MSSLWDSIVDSMKDTAGRVGSATAAATTKAKLKAEILLIDREITARQQAFGVELYDYVAPLSKHPSFYSSDDTLTKTLQPPLITAQREIAALQIKQGKQQERINQAAVSRAASYKPATNWQETVINLGKTTAHVGNETVLSTEMSMINTQIKAHKQEFGVSLYTTLEELEDEKQWLPTDREIRSIYDNCRRDIEKIKKRRKAKEQELAQVDGLDGSGNSKYDAPGSDKAALPSMYGNASVAQPSMYANSAPASAVPAVHQPSTSEFQPPAPQQTSYGSSQPVSAYYYDASGPSTTGVAPPKDPFGSVPQQPNLNDPFVSSMMTPQQHDPFATAQLTPQQTLQNGLFAGIVPPPPQQHASYGGQQQHTPYTGQQQHTPYTGQQQHAPYGGQQQQAPYGGQPNQFQQDPFAAATMTPLQQPYQQHDPFAAAPPPQQVTFDRFTGGGPPANNKNNSNTYDDPFAGL